MRHYTSEKVTAYGIDSIIARTNTPAAMARLRAAASPLVKLVCNPKTFALQWIPATNID